MDHLDLLRTLVAAGGAGPATAGAGLPPGELRFVLEYAEPPDLDAQAQQLRQLLGSEQIALVRLDPAAALERFAVLRCIGLERTLPMRELFGIGYALADALGLVSAEPDLGTPFYADPEPPQRAGIEAAPLSGLCRVSGDPPADRRWALACSGLIEAWSRSRGDGIVIAQPDTGIAQHDELDAAMLALDRAADILDGDTDPADPLNAGSANPGHGTGTASVAASREAGAISGAAPGARVAPIRCIDDVKVFDAAPVAAAIAHATRAGCDVISLSLGGVPSRALHAAVRAAVAADQIVVAAAGNCVGLVVWPARYSEVIAVAGTNIDDQPWKGSCRGRAVDLSAPAEFVWRAQRAQAADPTSGIGAGQGTSFAAPLVAGAAALWLALHGRAAVGAEGRRRGVAVQQLFRAALQASARRPAGWDGDNFGAGILDATALLALPLQGIPAGARSAAQPEAASVRQLLDETLGAGDDDPDFRWERYEPELAAIALAQARQGANLGALTPEAKSAATRPSPQLSRAVGASTDRRLHRYAERPGAASLARPPAAPSTAAEVRRMRVALPRAAGLESAGGVFDAARARDYLRGQAHGELVARVQTLLAAHPGGARALDSTIVGGVDEALASFAQGRSMSRTALASLEALVRLTGRPALRVRNGTLNLDDGRAGDWRDRLFLLLDDGRVQRRFAGVGRIDIDGVHAGTGFVAGAGCVLTNRHLLQLFAAPVPRRNAPDRWVLTEERVTIDFADAPSSRTAASRYAIRSVLGAGPDEIDDLQLDFAALDAALLEVEPVNAAGQALPEPIELVADAAATDRGRSVLVVGYPARPSVLPETSDGAIDVEVVRRLNEIFGSDYGSKYVAPGEIERAAGSWEQDVRGWTLTHDATTLGGNSGSVVLGIDEPVSAVGLHFAGDWRARNYAHALAAARAAGPGPGPGPFAHAGLRWWPPATDEPRGAPR